MVHRSYPESSIKTFRQCCEVQVTKKIQALARNVARVDIMSNVCGDATLTQDTRDRRGINNMCISVGRDTPIQHKLFKKILTVNENKAKLFQLVSDSLISQCNQGTIVCTKESGIVANIPMLTEHLQPYGNQKKQIPDCSLMRTMLLEMAYKVSRLQLMTQILWSQHCTLSLL